jgi:hypothetical protein
MGKIKTHNMEEEYTFSTLHSARYYGMPGRGNPGMETVSAGYLYPITLLPAEAGRGQPPPGKKVNARGCGRSFEPACR